MKRWIKMSLLTCAGLALAIQLVPVGRSNPPSEALVSGPPEVMSVLRASCLDCHSNETVWPWYAYVAPISWLVAYDVHEGRSELNLSSFGTLTPRKQGNVASQMVDMIDEHEMPLWQYTLMRDDRKVTPEGLATLRAWSETFE